MHKFKNYNDRHLNMVNAVLPGYIGCDRGGGVWKLYENEILKFEIILKNVNSNIVVKVFYLEKKRSSNKTLYLYIKIQCSCWLVGCYVGWCVGWLFCPAFTHQWEGGSGWFICQKNRPSPRMNLTAVIFGSGHIQGA